MTYDLNIFPCIHTLISDYLEGDKGVWEISSYSVQDVMSCGLKVDKVNRGEPPTQSLIALDLSLHSLKEEQLRFSKLPSCKSVMAPLFFQRAKGSLSAWLLPLPFDKVRPGSSLPVLTTDTAKISHFRCRQKGCTPSHAL